MLCGCFFKSQSSNRIYFVTLIRHSLILFHLCLCSYFWLIEMIVLMRLQPFWENYSCIEQYSFLPVLKPFENRYFMIKRLELGATNALLFIFYNEYNSWFCTIKQTRWGDIQHCLQGQKEHWPASLRPKESKDESSLYKGAGKRPQRDQNSSFHRLTLHHFLQRRIFRRLHQRPMHRHGVCWYLDALFRPRRPSTPD